jgi:hypothetical protein
MRVGRLVAQAFIGPPPAASVVLHLDGDVDNNRVENLAYDSLGDALPIRRTTTGSPPPAASSLQHRWWRFAGAGPPARMPRSVAAVFGVSPQTVNAIYRGGSWRHVGGPTRARAERLSDDDVRAIRIAYAEGMPRSDIMERWNVSESHLLLLRGKRRREAGGTICG